MSDNNNNNASTLKSYVDSAVGAAQNALGSLTGNTGDQAQGAVRQDKASLESEASHTAARVPGLGTVTAQGGAHKDDPDRAQGSWNQNVGSAKEAIGGFVGSDQLKAEGMQQNREGKGQEAKGQLSDLGQGLSDRAQGTVGGAVAGLTGDKSAQAKYDEQRLDGKAAQRGVEAELEKKA